MDESAWRVVATFSRTDDARAVADYLRGRPDVRRVGGSVSFTSGSTDVFGYAPTAEAIETVARVIRAGSDTLNVTPSRAGVARWLPEVSRWSDDSTAVPPTDDTFEVLVEFVGALFQTPPV